MTPSSTRGATLEDRARRHAALGEPLRLSIVEALRYGDRAPDQLATQLGVATNLLAHHLGVLDEAGLVERTRSHGDRRRRYLRLHDDALDDLLTPPSLAARSVLFVCTANSARSQLARALWQRHSPVAATSAGREPAEAVHADAVAVAAAHGLDLGDAPPRGYDEVSEEPDLIVSVCDLAREADMPFAGRRLHWSVADPVAVGQSAAFEAAYVELERRVTALAPYVVAGPSRPAREVHG